MHVLIPFPYGFCSAGIEAESRSRSYANKRFEQAMETELSASFHKKVQTSKSWSQGCLGSATLNRPRWRSWSLSHRICDTSQWYNLKKREHRDRENVAYGTQTLTAGGSYRYGTDRAIVQFMRLKIHDPYRRLMIWRCPRVNRLHGRTIIKMHLSFSGVCVVQFALAPLTDHSIKVLNCQIFSRKDSQFFNFKVKNSYFLMTTFAQSFLQPFTVKTACYPVLKHPFKRLRQSKLGINE